MSNSNPPAFPTSFNADYPHEMIGGLTMRDYFAARAMQGELASESLVWNENVHKSVSKSAYQFADAMLHWSEHSENQDDNDQYDEMRTEIARLRAELANQTALVEKCMVAMNENADKGEKAEAEVGRLVRKLALEREEFKAELDRLKAQPVQEPIERTAWLIEFSQNQQPVWVKSIWLDDGFTNDANEAILFPTKRCAEDVLDRLFSTPRNKTVFRAARKVYRVTEQSGGR